jgi:nucleotide-binding universal stress UspA family protein
MGLRSILISHDGSALSGAILDSLVPLLSVEVAVTLLHVVEDKSVDPEVALAETERKLAAQGVRVTRAKRTGTDPAGVIIDFARETKPDLLAMSTHGRGGVDRWLRGSVAERVLRSSPVPLLMVNPRTHSGSKIANVLVPLAESVTSVQLLESLIPLARTFGARLTLLFVDWDAATDTKAQATRRREMRKRDVEEWLAGPMARLAAEGIEAEVRIVHGDVAEEILRAAEPDAFDLLALSTHGRSGASRWLLGSVAEKVLAQCRIPILLHRTRERE